MYTIFDENFDDEFINEFNETDLYNFFSQLKRQAQNFLYNSKMPPEIYLNATIYAHCCRNIIADLAKFRHLQVLTSEDNVKLNAYTAAWWIRRKPFQHKDNCSKKFLYVNESFAATLLFQASHLYDKTTGQYTVSKDKLAAIARQLMNYLKFQQVTSQSLELFLNGLNF
ncbi:MAG: hypothetical protein IJS29_06925 [Selenomonadaceae bacterium]|nr:hypothetical protein [Selenomonadaceae bacterium]